MLLLIVLLVLLFGGGGFGYTNGWGGPFGPGLGGLVPVLVVVLIVCLLFGGRGMHLR